MASMVEARDPPLHRRCDDENAAVCGFAGRGRLGYHQRPPLDAAHPLGAVRLALHDGPSIPVAGTL